MTPSLEFRDVRKSYGKTEALKGVSLAVGAGEFVGLLGPNGSGKSTLFQIAAGLFVPDAGSVSAFGLGYRKNPSEILRKLGVVFQTRSIDLEMSVVANLKFHGALFGLSGKALTARIDEVTRLLEIDAVANKTVRMLSGGNQRRVEIARALLNQPELLLMDEPSVGLDPESRRLLNEHIIGLQRTRKVAVLWATHLVEEVAAADRIVLIAEGLVLAAGTPAEICELAGAATLAEAYLALVGSAAVAA
ncbi:ATP-binding cassette domain-containing protein [Devosia sp. A449]